MPGWGRRAAQDAVAETGVDMTRFRTGGHLSQVLNWSRGMQQILRLWARQMHLRASRMWRADQALGL